MHQQSAPAEAYPLYWPTGRKRTEPHRRHPSKFETSFTRARDELIRELKLLGATGVVLSTNIALRRDGLERAGQIKRAAQRICDATKRECQTWARYDRETEPAGDLYGQTERERLPD